MNLDIRLTALLEAARDEPIQALPALLAALGAAQATVAARLANGNMTTDVGAATRAPEAGAVWITPEQAAGIAQVPVRRVYTWARGQRWAARPSRRCLRIAETGFRRWLAARSA